MELFKRIFLIVIDSLGIGAMANAKDYGDDGADTLGHIDEVVEHLNLPHLEMMGLGNLKKLRHVAMVENPKAYYGILNERSVGKDTMTGHWEMMGLYLEKPFQVFTDTGFPKELLDELSRRTGHRIVGNKAASGTEILEELGEHQMATGDMIVYTSADSVLQICGHEETFGLQELYRCCEIARELTMRDEWKVGRVIARPYIGQGKGRFKRTSNRHDYALKPFGVTVLDLLKGNGLDVISVGKICDIFDGEGITQSYHSDSSVHGMEQTIQLTKQDFTGFCFVNLVDFDALWGHRRDPVGYGAELEKFDEKLGELLPLIGEDDLLMITADHGNDPTFRGTDHTKEQVPLFLYSPSLTGNGPIGTKDSFGVIGATILQNFGLERRAEMVGEVLKL